MKGGYQQSVIGTENYAYDAANLDSLPSTVGQVRGSQMERTLVNLKNQGSMVQSQFDSQMSFQLYGSGQPQTQPSHHLHQPQQHSQYQNLPIQT
mmetsp:Transcript_7210/g.12171  ORF Transcript_7210/g.12171 Transcript_7210/m.12171 type:complete len:94 (+) Transcript_7210:235-516(+)